MWFSPWNFLSNVDHLFFILWSVFFHAIISSEISGYATSTFFDMQCNKKSRIRKQIFQPAILSGYCFWLNKSPSDERLWLYLTYFWMSTLFESINCFFMMSIGLWIFNSYSFGRIMLNRIGNNDMIQMNWMSQNDWITKCKSSDDAV